MHTAGSLGMQFLGVRGESVEVPIASELAGVYKEADRYWARCRAPVLLLRYCYAWPGFMNIFVVIHLH